MPNVNDLNDLIRGLMRTLMGWPAHSFRPAQQLAPTGDVNDAFATVLVSSIDPVADPTMSAIVVRTVVPAPSTNLTESVYVHQRLVASVNFYRSDALMNAQRLAAVLNSSLAVESMQKIGLGLAGCSNVRNLTGVDDAVWESRAQIDIRFHILSITNLTIATYNKFPITISTEESTYSKEVIAP